MWVCNWLYTQYFDLSGKVIKLGWLKLMDLNVNNNIIINNNNNSNDNYKLTTNNNIYDKLAETLCRNIVCLDINGLTNSSIGLWEAIHNQRVKRCKNIKHELIVNVSTTMDDDDDENCIDQIFEKKLTISKLEILCEINNYGWFLFKLWVIFV